MMMIDQHTGGAIQEYRDQEYDRKCWNCGDASHVCPQCPKPRTEECKEKLRQVRLRQQYHTEPVVQPAAAVTVSAPVAKTSSVKNLFDTRYATVEIIVAGIKHDCLLDSGADLSMAPRRVLGNAVIQPTSVTMAAANGTVINILGQVELCFRIQGKLFAAEFLVSDDVSLIMLGYDWLAKVGAVWDFSKKIVKIGEQEIRIDITPKGKEEVKPEANVNSLDIPLAEPVSFGKNGSARWMDDVDEDEYLYDYEESDYQDSYASEEEEEALHLELLYDSEGMLVSSETVPKSHVCNAIFVVSDTQTLDLVQPSLPDTSSRPEFASHAYSHVKQEVRSHDGLWSSDFKSLISDAEGESASLDRFVSNRKSAFFSAQLCELVQREALPSYSQEASTDAKLAYRDTPNKASLAKLGKIENDIRRPEVESDPLDLANFTSLGPADESTSDGVLVTSGPEVSAALETVDDEFARVTRIVSASTLIKNDDDDFARVTRTEGQSAVLEAMKDDSVIASHESKPTIVDKLPKHSVLNTSRNNVGRDWCNVIDFQLLWGVLLFAMAVLCVLNCFAVFELLKPVSVKPEASERTVSKLVWTDYDVVSDCTESSDTNPDCYVLPVAGPVRNRGRAVRFCDSSGGPMVISGEALSPTYGWNYTARGAVGHAQSLLCPDGQLWSTASCMAQIGEERQGSWRPWPNKEQHASVKQCSRTHGMANEERKCFRYDVMPAVSYREPRYSKFNRELVLSGSLFMRETPRRPCNKSQFTKFQQLPVESKAKQSDNRLLVLEQSALSASSNIRDAARISDQVELGDTAAIASVQANLANRLGGEGSVLKTVRGDFEAGGAGFSEITQLA
jgi:hypothetical protein